MTKQELLSRAIANNPTFSQAYSRLADCDTSPWPGKSVCVQGVRRSKLELYTLAIHYDPTDYYPYYRLGVLLTTWKQKVSSVQLRDVSIFLSFVLHLV
jgi:hypothetical protein